MSKTKSPSSEKTISAQHRLFADTYLSNGFKGQEAAIVAKYSKKRARITASELLDRPDIQAYLDERMKKTHMSANEALSRLGGQARGDVAEFIGLTPEELKAHPRSWLIKKVKVGVYFPDKPETAPPDKELAIALFAKVVAKEDQDVSELDSQNAYKPIHYVEYVELYDSQSALLNIIKQQQLSSGMPTEIVAIVPTVTKLIEMLHDAGQDANAVFQRMMDKIAQDSNA